MDKQEGKICSACGIWKPYLEYTSYTKVNKYGDEITYYYKNCKNCTNANYRANYQRISPKKKKADYRKIGKVQQEAAAHGMSYGQWVAHLEYLKQKEEKNKNV